MKEHKLRVLNLDDNLIPSLVELQPLISLSNLHELTLKSKQTENPVCRIAKYTEKVIAILKGLETLDGVYVAKNLVVKENIEPNEESKPIDVLYLSNNRKIRLGSIWLS